MFVRTHTHTPQAVLSSGLDITDSKLLQLFRWGNSAMKAQPWKGAIFWLEGEGAETPDLQTTQENY